MPRWSLQANFEPAVCLSSPHLYVHAQDLLNSGYLTEVDSFSKMLHGVAALVPDLAQAVPYWIDDASVRESLQACAPSPDRSDAG